MVRARHSAGRRFKLPTVLQSKPPAVMFTIVLMSVKKIPDATELCYALLFI